MPCQETALLLLAKKHRKTLPGDCIKSVRSIIPPENEEDAIAIRQHERIPRGSTYTIAGYLGLC